MHSLLHVALVGFPSLFYSSIAIDSPLASPEVLIRPAIIIFDPGVFCLLTDKTVWPFTISDVILPLFKKNENVILDCSYKHLKIFRQIPSLFEELHRLGHKLAVISQSVDNTTICQLLDFYGLDQFITYKEIYPGNKTEHIEAIHLKSDIDYGDMLYLEDDFKEIEVIADLGIVCILVGSEGITMQDVRKGFHIFSTESPEYSYSEDSHESSYLHKE